MTATYPPTPDLEHDARMKEQFGYELDDWMRTERDIVWALCHHLDAAGFGLTGVYDGEDLIRLTDPKEAMEHVFNLDECSLRFKFRGMLGERHKTMGVALIMGNGNDGLDIISDYSSPEDDQTGWDAAMDAFDTGQFQNGSNLDIVHIQIGRDTANPDSGSDQYLILRRRDGEALTPKQAKEWLLPRYYSDSSAHGAYFCHDVRAVQAEYSTTHVIATVQHRYDI